MSTDDDDERLHNWRNGFDEGWMQLSGSTMVRAFAAGWSSFVLLIVSVLLSSVYNQIVYVITFPFDGQTRRCIPVRRTRLLKNSYDMHEFAQ